MARIERILLAFCGGWVVFDLMRCLYLILAQ